MPRRNLWSPASASAGELPPTWEGQPPAASLPPVAAPKPASSPAMDMLRVAPVKTRKRDWEKRQDQVGYRGVSIELRTTMKETAHKLRVPIDELARAFLSYGALAHRTGELKLAPVLKPQRLTLFPEGWLSQSVPAAPVGKARRDQAWRSLVVYRGIPAELRETVKQTAAQLHVPVGEVAAAFLQHALTAYQTGKLLLQPQPVMDRMTLAGGID